MANSSGVPTVKVKEPKQPRIPAVKVKQEKITPPKTTQAEKQIAAFEKQYVQQQKALAQQYKAFGLHSVSETGTKTPAYKSQTTPYRRYP